MNVPKTVVEPAPAKINLYLHVTGRRLDGYHRLDSLVAFTDIGDTLTLTEEDGLFLSIEGPFADGLADEADDNLVMRAARALADATGWTATAAILLTKRLPIASGVGGGSADAAATLRGLVALWGIHPEEELLHEVALSLGADVPVCLASRSAYFGGIGDVLDPAPDLAGVPILLANPGVSVPTGAVFQARTAPFSNPARLTAAEVPAEGAMAPSDLAHALAERRNDLEEPAVRLFPAVAETLAALRALPGCLHAAMSGSGGTCYALFETPEAARAGEAALLDVGTPWARAGHLL